MSEISNDVIHVKGLSPEERFKLVSYVASRGINALFISSEDYADEELADHYRETYPPTSRDSYLGKEHFWRVGDEIGLNKRVTGRFFHNLVYPVCPDQTAPIVPNDIGLVVNPRNDTELPWAPSTTPPQGSGPNWELHTKTNPDVLPPLALAVQVGSIIDLASKDFTEVLSGFAKPDIPKFKLLGWHLNQIVEF